MNNRLYTIADAASILGVSTKTLRRWDQRGSFVPTRTAGNQRRYTQEQIDQFKVQSSKFKVSSTEKVNISVNEIRNPKSEIRNLASSAIPAEPLFDLNAKPKAPQANHGLPSVLSQLPSNSFLKHHFLLKYKSGLNESRSDESPLNQDSGSEKASEPASFARRPLAKLSAFKIGFAFATLVLIMSVVGALTLTKYNVVAGLAEKKEQFAKFIASLPKISFQLKNNDLSFAPQEENGAVLAAATGGPDLLLRINVPVNIGIGAQESSAILNIASEDQGFLAPRMTTVKRDAIESPAAGLFVYNTDTNHYNMYNGTSWQGLFSSIGDSTLGEAFTKTGKEGNSLYFHGTGGGVGQLTAGAISGTQIYTFPNASGEISLLGQTISNSELENSKITISPGTNITGGGDVSLGGSVTVTLKDSIALAGTLTVAGATLLNGNVGLGDTTSDVITATGYFGSSLIPATTSLYDLGTAALSWNNVYANNVFAPASGTSGYWQRNNNALSPTNITDDLLLGATSTSSAKFGFINVAGGTPTATISANSGSNATYLTGDGTLATTNRGTLTIGNSSTYNTTGNVLINPNGTGNVGIGTTSPLAPLHVNNPSGEEALRLMRADGTDNASLVFWKQGVGNDIGGISFVMQNTSGTDKERARIGARHVSSSPGVESGLLQFYTMNSGTLAERMRIDNTGNVGIGTTSPTGLLHVSGISGGKAVAVINNNGTVGDIFTASSSGTTRFVITNNGRVGFNLGANISTALGTLDVRPNAGNGGTISIASASGSTSFAALLADNTGVGDLFTASKSGATKFVITNSGNVGIGTNLPVTMLDVRGAASVSGALTVDSTATIQTTNLKNLTIGSSTTGGIALAPAGTTALYAMNGGNVGIGTTTPATLFDVNSLFNIQSGGNIGINQTNPASFKLEVGGNIGPSSGNSYDIGSSSRYYNNIYVNTVNATTIGGSAAITGTTTQDFLINSDNASSDAEDASLTFARGTGNTHVQFKWNSTTKQLYTNSPSLAILPDSTIAFSGTAALMVNQIQNQDIFTASYSGTPKFTITNAGTATMSGDLILDSVGSLQTTKAQTLTIGGSTTGDISFKPGNSSSSLYLSSTGTAGLGATPGLPKLTIEQTGTGGQFAMVISKSGTVYTRFGVAGSAGNVVFEDAANDTVLTTTETVGGKLILGTRIHARLTIDTNGLVGISTTSPLATLDVRPGISTGGTIAIASASGSTSFAALLADNTGTGDLFTASKSGATKFVILNNGNLQFAGTTNFLTTLASAATAAQTITFPDATGTICISGQTCATSGTVGYWQRNSGALAPANITDDLLLGGISTTSAKFAFINNAGGNPTASISGNLSLIVPTTAGANTFNYLNNSSLNFQRSPGGDDGLTSTLYLRNNGNIGINNTSPGKLLTVGSLSAFTVDNMGGAILTFQGDANQTGFLKYAQAGYPSSFTQAFYGSLVLAYNTLGANTGGSGFKYDTSNPAAAIYLGNGTTVGDILFNVAGAGTAGNTISWTEAMTLKNSGNLGINNTAPLAKLDVGGSASLSANISLRGTGTAHTFDLLDNGSLNFRTSVGGSGTTNSTFFIANGTNTTSGNIGIGTTSPLAALDIRGNLGTVPAASISAISSFAALLVDNSGVGDLFTASKSGATKFVILNNGNLQFAGTTNFLTTLASAATAAQTITFPDATGTICISGQTCATSGTVGYWQRNSGALAPANITDDLLLGGISTTSAKFAFINNAGGSPTASISGNLSLIVPTTAGANTFNYLNNSSLNFQRSPGGDDGLTSTLYLRNNGNVGIGITAPIAKLHVEDGNVRIVRDDGTSAELALINDISASNPNAKFTIIGHESSTGDPYMVFAIGGPGTGWAMGLDNSDSDKFKISYNASYPNAALGTGDVFTINTSGNVGIGNTTPLAALDVTGSASLSANIFMRGAGTAHTFNILDNGTLNFQRYPSGNAANASSVMYLGNNGNIGINTTSPLATLDIRGNLGTTPAASISATSSFAALILDNSGIGDLFTASKSGLPKFVISNSGNVGIGANAPGSLLTLGYNGGNGWLSGVDSAGTGIDYMFKINAADQIQVGTALNMDGGITLPTDGGLVTLADMPLTGSAANGYTFRIGSTNVMTVAGIGNGSGGVTSFGLGVGTTSAALRLDVQDFQSATAAAQIYNTNSGTDADGLIIKLGNSSTTAVAAANHFISFETFGIGIVGSVQGSTGKGVTYATSGIADFAEYFKKDQSHNIPFGSVVCFDSNGLAVKCDNNSNKIIGVASEAPAFLGGENLGDKSVAVGLVGQVRTRVSTANGEIKIGDPLTTSSTAGVAVKATSTGQILGKAIEGFNGSGEGKILVSVNITWYNPSIYVSYDGTLAGMAATVTSIGDQLTLQGEVLASTSASLAAKTDYVLANDPLFDSLNNKVNDLQSKVDLLSAQVAQQASISAFLTEIVNSQVLGASTSAILDLGDVELRAATVSGDLMVLGRATVTDLGVTGNINNGLLAIHGLDGEINTLAGDLYLQKSGLGGVDILAGKVVIDTLGNITVAGKVTAEEVESKSYTILGDSSIGSATIPVGLTSIEISTSIASSSSKIFLTSTSLTDKQITVVQKSSGKFKVGISQTSTSPITFDWWIVGNR